MATSRISAEGGVINTVWLEMKLFEQKNNGRSPTNWAEFGPFINLERLNQKLQGTAVYPLQEHYVFVSTDIPMSDVDKGNVVLIRTGPVPQLEGTNEGRLIISRYDGTLKLNWLSEDKIQKMLADAGVTELPQPEPWPPPTNNATESPSVTTPIRQVPPATTQVTEPEHTTRPSVGNPPIQPAVPEPVAQMPAEKSSQPPVSKSWLLAIVVIALGLGIIVLLLRRRKS